MQKTGVLFSTIPYINTPNVVKLVPKITSNKGVGYQPCLVEYPLNSSSTTKQMPRTVYDALMGPILNDKQVCLYCKNTKKMCMGHEGYMNLWKRMIHPTYYPFLIDFVKNNICTNCLTYNPKFKRCIKCNNTQQKINAKVRSLFWLKTETGRELPSDALYKVISEISATDTNFNYPLADLFFLNIFHVIPSFMRPHLKKMKNPFNTIYLDIMEMVNLLKGGPSLLELYQILECISGLVWMMISQTYKKMKSKLAPFPKISKNYKSLQADFNIKALYYDGKMATIRRLIESASVSGMLRCVINPEPNIPITHIMIPVPVAAGITIKEDVNQFNLQQMQKMLKHSPNYPSITIVQKVGEANKRTITESNFKTMTVSIGDKIERHLISGDYCYFYRAPALSYPSMTACIVQIYGQLNSHYSGNDIGDFVIKMNNLLCKIFNADFDGDAMSCVFAPSPLSMCEMMFSNSVTLRLKAIYSAEYWIDVKEDTIIGMALMTMRNRKFHVRDALDMLHNMKGKHNFNMDQPEFSMNEIVSKLFSKRLNYTGTSGIVDKDFADFLKYDEKHANVVIKDGQLLSGILDGKTLNKLLENCMATQGNSATVELIENFLKLALRYLSIDGYSAGVSDTYLHPKYVQEIKDLTDQAVQYCKDLIIELVNNYEEYEVPQGTTKIEFIKTSVYEVLNTISNYKTAMTVMNIYNNSFMFLAQTSAKGKALNILQMFLRLGTIIPSAQGKPLPVNLTADRCSIFNGKHELSPHAFGFIANCLTQGMNIADFVYLVLHARIGLLDKTFIISSAGAQYRVLSKNGEQFVVYNQKVLNIHTGKIFDFMGWCLGFRLDYLEKNEIPDLLKSDEELFALIYEKNNLYIELFKKLLLYGKEYVKTLCVDANFFKLSKLPGTVYAPFNIDAMFKNINLEKVNDAVLKENISIFTKYIERFHTFYVSYKRTLNGLEIAPYYTRSTDNMILLLITKFNHKILSGQTTEQLHSILNEIEAKFKNSLLTNGYTIGLITAMVISEPITQFALNSIHAREKTSTKKEGLKRIKEIISLVSPEKLDAPTTRLLLRKNVSMETAKTLAYNLTYIKFNEYIKDITPYRFYSMHGGNLMTVHPDFLDENPTLDTISKFIHRDMDLVLPHGLRVVINKKALDSAHLDIYNMLIRFQNTNYYYSLRDVSKKDGYRNNNEDYVMWFIPKKGMKKKNITLTGQELGIAIANLREIPIYGYMGIQAVNISIRQIFIDEKKEERIMLETKGSNMNLIRHKSKFPDIDFKYTYFDGVSINNFVFGFTFSKYSVFIEMEPLIEKVHPFVYSCINNMLDNSILLKPISRIIKSANLLHNAGTTMPYQGITENFCAGTIHARGFTDGLLAGCVPKIGSGATDVHINWKALSKLFGLDEEDKKE